MNINLNQILKIASPSKRIQGIQFTPRVPTSEFQQDPIGWFNKYPPTLRYILNVILEADNNRRNPTLLHSTIAERAGCSLTTVKLYLNILSKAGLISRIGRYWQSSIYRVSDYFHNPHNRTKLGHLFKAFCWLPLIFLSICNGQWIKSYDIFQSSKRLLDVNNIYKKYNSKFFIETKDNQLSVTRTQKETMNIKDYPNMHKRNESDNNQWARIVRKAHAGSQKVYSDGKRPQCDGGSVKSELTAKRERRDLEAQAWREMEASTKTLAPVDFIKDILSKQSWML
jgi:hypothetical protein